MQTAHEMFIYGLTDMLSGEKQLVEALGKQAEESFRPDLKKAFENHREQTENQIQRLEQCFEELSEVPKETECKGIHGLIEEHDAFMKEDPSEDLTDIFNVGAASKVERFEITTYEELIHLADLMNHKKVSRLLKDSLKEEEQMKKIMKSFEKKLKPEHLSREGEEEYVEVGNLDTNEKEMARKGNSRTRNSSAHSKSRRRRAA